MRLVPLLAPTSAAVQEALTRRGVEPVRAEAAARGIQHLAVVLDDLDAAARDRIAQAARQHGLDILTGDDWAFLSGATSTLAAFARPGITVLMPEIAAQLAGVAGAVLEPPVTWVMGRGTVALDRPVVVGIVNVTPDSFSDGGRYLDPVDALRHAETLLQAGADMLDVGAESTRPGQPEAVPAAEEWRRLAPVLEVLVRQHPALPVSVDTVKAEIVRRALETGVWAVNDVSGLRLEPAIADACAAHDAGLVLMHSRGTTRDMASYEHAHYGHVAADVALELRAAVALATARGVRRERIVLDPGLGFSKTPEQNLAVLRDLPLIGALGHPVMVGPSRKRFLGVVTGGDVGDRDRATAAACVTAYLGGAALFRVHAVDLTREALSVAHAVRSA